MDNIKNNLSSDSEEDYIIQGSVTEGGLIEYEGAKDFFETVLGGMIKKDDLDSSSSESSSESESEYSSLDEKSPFIEYDSDLNESKSLNNDSDENNLSEMVEDKLSIHTEYSEENSPFIETIEKETLDEKIPEQTTVDENSPFIEEKYDNDEKKKDNNDEKDLKDVKNIVKKILKKL